MTPPWTPFDATLGYAGNALDRAETFREKAGFVLELRAGTGAATLVLVGDDVVLRADGAPWFGLAEAEAIARAEREVFLGRDAEHGRFAMALPAAHAEACRARTDLVVSDLRSLTTAGTLHPGDLGALAQAKAVLHWHRQHRFCAACGTETTIAAAGWRRECPACGTHHFPRTDPVVIMMAVDGERCLLGRQPRFPPGMYSCLAGFLEPGETVEAAVRRELFEEAGITTGAVDYRGSQPWPFPASIMIGCRAQAVSTALTIDHAELEDARWFTREETRAILAGTHPEGFRCPPTMAIAHHLMRGWAEEG